MALTSLRAWLTSIPTIKVVMGLTSVSARVYAGGSGIPGMLPLLSPGGATPLWLIRSPPERPSMPLRPDGPAATKAAAQASTGCGSEVTASQANRLWESFQAQGSSELSRLSSVYLSVPAYPILPGQTTESGLSLSYKGPMRQGIPTSLRRYYLRENATIYWSTAIHPTAHGSHSNEAPPQ
jgi:hypothetical protein